MAMNLTDSGVIATAGRGRNKTVVLEVSFKELEAWAKRVEIDERALWRRSYGRACAALKGRFSKIVRNAGGVEGVPKFHDFEAFTKTASHPLFFGKAMAVVRRDGPGELTLTVSSEGLTPARAVIW